VLTLENGYSTNAYRIKRAFPFRLLVALVIAVTWLFSLFVWSYLFSSFASGGQLNTFWPEIYIAAVSSTG